MELKVQIHLNEEMENDKEVVDRLVETNLNTKISAYLKKYEDKKDAEGKINLKIEKNKKDLDDLINNLFKHLKEELSAK